VFLFTESYRREYRCQVCTAGSPLSTITAANVGVRGRNSRLRMLYQWLQKLRSMSALFKSLAIHGPAESRTIVYLLKVFSNYIFVI